MTYISSSQVPALRDDAKVLIVGSGPTGLTAAAFLAKQNISFDVIDTRAGPVNDSRALGVHARTLEFMSMLGLDQEFIEQGHPTRYMTWHRGTRKLFKLDFNAIADQTRYPYMLVLPQARSERILVSHLERQGLPIGWQTTLKRFVQHDEHVSAELLLPGGRLITKQYQYVIACDGAGSSLRVGSDIAFEGETYPMRFLLSEVRITDDKLDRSSSHVFMGEHTTVAVIPQPDGIYRVVGPDFSKQDASNPLGGSALVDFGDFANFLKKNNLLQHVNMQDPSRLLSYRINKRVAAKFRERRVFLAGDAAHIHSPAGGQGMNTGLHDAVNLSWKIAAVLKGTATDSLLDTYEAERRPAAIRIVNGADAAMMKVVSRKLSSRLFFDLVAPVITQFYQPRKLMEAIAQISATYPAFRGMADHSDMLGPQVGSRLHDWGTQSGGSSNRSLGSGRLVAFVSGDSQRTAAMRQRVAAWPSKLRPDIHQLIKPISTKPAHAGFEGLILARPDGYVASSFSAHSPRALAVLEQAIAL